MTDNKTDPDDDTPSPTQAENDAAALAARGLSPKGKDDVTDDAEDEAARKAKAAAEAHAAHVDAAKMRAVPTGGDNPTFKNR